MGFFGIGMIAYVIAGIGIAYLNWNGYEPAATRAFVAFITLPIMLPVFLLLMTPTIIIVGAITGTPVVSFTYAFSAMKRNFRSVLGAIILASAIASLALAAANLKS